jgi:glycosyltransferase involved in cell wall biosynthesis
MHTPQFSVNRPYKVAFIISSLHRGGAESRLVDVLKRLDRSKFDPFLFVGKDGGDLLADVRDQRVYVGVSEHTNIHFTLWALWRTLRREQPDVVWCISHRVLGFFGRLFGYLLHTPVIVISLHGMTHEGERVMDWPNRLLTRLRTDKIVVLSQKYRDWLVAEGTPESLVTVQYNGVDTERFSPTVNRQTCKQTVLRIDPSRLVIGTVGNLRPKKAHEVLIRAAKQVVQKCPQALFVIVGEGQRRHELQQLIEQLNLSQHVRLLGQRHDVPDILRALDIFTLTSDDGEGCSNATLEALGTGLPVVTTDFGGASELVNDEVGIVVPRRNEAALAEALLQLLHDPERRQAMGQAARQRAIEHFSLERMIRARESLLLDLLEK